MIRIIPINSSEPMNNGNETVIPYYANIQSGSRCSVVANMLECDIVRREFELQSRY